MEKTIKIIGFDMDNVVIDTTSAIKEQGILLLLKEFKERRDDIDLSEMLSLGAKHPGLSKILATGTLTEDIKEEDIMSLIEEDGTEFPTTARFLLETEWWKDILIKAKPMEGIEVFRKICENEKYETHIISRRLKSDLMATIKLLKKNRISVIDENVHLRADISISEIEFKKQMVEKYGIEIFYDDLGRVVKEIPQAKLFTSWQDVEKDLR